MTSSKLTRHAKREKQDRTLAIIAIVTIILAWFAGIQLNQENEYDCRQFVFPEATECRDIGGGTVEAILSADGIEQTLGWARIEEASGYAGPISVMTGVNPAGELVGVAILDQSETPAYLGLVSSSTYLESFVGLAANSPFQLGENVDGVSRATFTSKGILEAAKLASYTIAETQLGLKVTRESQTIEFGMPEYVLIALFAIGFVAHRGGFPYKKVFRWSSLLVGMYFLGFVYNSPITIAHFNSLLLGFWPDWHTNIYWFLLMGGFIFVITVDRKNPYCQWFCPFGAAQECLGTIGGAKTWVPRKGRFELQWAQRGLAWAAIIMGLLLRNPGVSSYEIFGALFSFNAAGLQWAILIIVLLASLFIRRPWCNYLCPVAPAVDLIFAVRKWTSKGLRTWKKQRNATQL